MTGLIGKLKNMGYNEQNLQNLIDNLVHQET